MTYDAPRPACGRCFNNLSVHESRRKQIYCDTCSKQIQKERKADYLADSINNANHRVNS